MKLRRLPFMSSSAAAVIMVVAVFLAATTTTATASDEFYSAYNSYPDYCSTPAMMESRKIPPLKQQDSRLGETRLVHVSAITRPGTSAPNFDNDIAADEQCWDTYDSSTWDCHVKTEIMVAPQDGQDAPLLLFEKNYDALMNSENDLSNNLVGTCQQGQLLMQGYDQQTQNGIFLRDAYTYDSETMNHDVRMRLIDLRSEPPWKEPQVYFRTDDHPSSQISGAVLLRSMLLVEPASHSSSSHNKEKNEQATISKITLHLADRDRDVLAINEDLCPRLTKLRESFQKSSTFRLYDNSQEAHEIRKFIKKDLKASSVEGFDALNCLMPTVCTDRSLPESLEYGTTTETPTMFDRMINFQYERNSMHLVANDAEFSKLAMAPLWAEIMDKINAIVVTKGNDDEATRFALYSGHDETVAALMASLGIWNVTAWPPYATMLLIEVHELIDGQTDHSVYKSKFAFRLIQNGKVITNQIEGCLDDADLCDIQVLTDIVSEFATRDRDCGNKKRHSTTRASSGGNGGAFHSFLMILLGSLLGGVGMAYYLRRSSRQRGGYYGKSDGGEVALSTTTAAYSDNPPAENGYHDAEPADDDNGGIRMI